MAVAALFGDQEGTRQVNCIVSSMHEAGPLYPQLLTYRCGAANRRFGPVSDIEPHREAELSTGRPATDRNVRIQEDLGQFIDTLSPLGTRFV
jgi:hypothetical protein